MSNEIGTLGEQLVARWLQLRDYQILNYNWHCRWGEIDLIAQDCKSEAIAFVEVKTRSAHNWDVDGLLAISAAKQQKLIQTAELFLAKQPLLAELPCRFDVGLVSYRSSDYETRSELNYQNKIHPSLDTIDQLNQLEIGQAINIDRHQFTIKDYLTAAFD
jgi:putative endonuclease